MFFEKEPTTKRNSRKSKVTGEEYNDINDGGGVSRPISYQ